MDLEQKDYQNVRRRPTVKMTASQIITLKDTSDASLASLDGGLRPDKYEDSKNSLALSALEEEDIEVEYEPISWISIIFLPFQNWWKIIIIWTVCVKCCLGPMTAIFPIMVCSREFDAAFLEYLSFYYRYVGDAIYLIDTFLYIVHRQVEEESMKREYLPKSAIFLILDLAGLIPFYNFNAEDVCGGVSIWPNILSFSELLLIYRVGNYFSLRITHSYLKLALGYIIMFLIIMNAVTCLFLVFTISGLCANCHGSYDWRQYTLNKLENRNNYTLYMTAGFFMLSVVTHKMIDQSKPNTYLEIFIVIVLAEISYFVLLFYVHSKLFAESHHRCLRYVSFQNRLGRILMDSKRIHTSPKAQKIVSNYYSLMWTKQRGILSMPKVIEELPRTLRIDIKQDLVWDFFRHSPTFRKTSNAYKRYLGDHVKLKFKLPGESFFAGRNALTHIYYIKQGIVQLHSADDFTVSLLSVSDGTLFGDVSFMIPPQEKNLAARCLTFCEVLTLSRRAVVKSLFMFPEDRRYVLKAVQERLEHAKLLFTAKLKYRGWDRCDDEDFAWIKHRWWEINKAVKDFEKTAHKGNESCMIPCETDEFHCSKYIGQLVLCQDIELQRQSIFLKIKFPWVFDADSNFSLYWYKFVKFFVYTVLLVYTPVITYPDKPVWFHYYVYVINVVYSLDILLTILTTKGEMRYTHSKLSTAILYHFQQVTFLLDILSLHIWVDFISNAMVKEPSMFADLTFYNRLLKTYMLFYNKFDKNIIGISNVRRINFKVAFTHFFVYFVPSYVIFSFIGDTNELDVNLHFQAMCLQEFLKHNETCDHATLGYYGKITIPLAWLTKWTFIETTKPLVKITIYDLVLETFVSLFYTSLSWYLQMIFVAAMYLKYRDKAAYQYFATNINSHYKAFNIHPDLLVRLNRYIDLHWRYAEGTYILYDDFVKKEVYNIFWEVQGKVAEKVIGSSALFRHADRKLIRQVAEKAKFVMVPKHTILFAYGVQVETVTWVVQGCIKCEYINDKDEIKTTMYENGLLLAFNAVIFGQTCLRTFIADSDAEIVYVKLQDFVTVLKLYPHEWSYFETCIHELEPAFDALYFNVKMRNKNYQKKLRQRIHTGNVNLDTTDEKVEKDASVNTFIMRIVETYEHYRKDPESPLIKKWLTVRAILIFIQLTVTPLQGGSGAVIFPQLEILRGICQLSYILDFFLKLFLPFYNKDGVIVTSKRSTAANYLSKSFMIDFMGFILSLDFVVGSILQEEGEEVMKNAKMAGLMCHLYMITGCFDYFARKPDSKSMLITILKFQVLLFLIMIEFSFYYIRDCIEIRWGKNENLLSMRKHNKTCWLPEYFTLDTYPTHNQLHLVMADTLNMIQGAFFGVFQGHHEFKIMKIGQSVLWNCMTVFSWYQSSYCIALLILWSRGERVFENGIAQLKVFLQGERVEKNVIDQAVNHFTYWHLRSQGVDTTKLMSNQFSVVFKQDLRYYFFKTTLKALDEMINGNEALNRQLAGACNINYFLPNYDVMRENQICTHIYIVHRGKIEITQDGKLVTVLAKGSIFGQLKGSKLRPVKVSARASEYCDVLKLSFKDFHDFIDKDVRKAIKQNEQAKLDFMAVKKTVVEHPFTTIEFILRSKKVLRPPFMKRHIKAETSTWYTYWLLWSWVISPVLAAGMVLTMLDMPNAGYNLFLYLNLVLDFLHMTHLIIDCYEVKFNVVQDAMQYEYVGWWKLTEWYFYVDVVSLIIPLMSLQRLAYQQARIIRMFSIVKYYKMFLKGYHAKTYTTVLKVVLIVLMLHAMTCGWILVACAPHAQADDTFPVNYTNVSMFVFRKHIDADQWVLPHKRAGKSGCPKITYAFSTPGDKKWSFLVPTDWRADYLIALLYISVLQLNSNLDNVQPLTVKALYYKNVVAYILHLLRLWMMTTAISYVYSKYRQMYNYDHRVDNLIQYLKQNGISTSLTDSVRTYTRLLWQKHKGHHLPEITHQAPQCLREDIFSALYIYHLQTPELFQDLPISFLNQLVVRLKRVIIFPGKYIVQEGEVHPCMYFIHEGEVEKWYTDSNGDIILLTLLSTNGYFGFLPGLFPTIPYKYSYKSRTIVDLVYLQYWDWQDLLRAYPELKKELYSKAKTRKKRFDEKHASTVKRHSARYSTTIHQIRKESYDLN